MDKVQNFYIYKDRKTSIKKIKFSLTDSPSWDLFSAMKNLGSSYYFECLIISQSPCR
jgi:hypothetical protein